MGDIEIKRLECRIDGHDKFYEMIVHDDGTWTAHYGRIGTAGTSIDYPASEFTKKLNEKLRKGYVEVSNRFVGRKTGDPDPVTASGNPCIGIFRWEVL